MTYKHIKIFDFTKDTYLCRECGEGFKADERKDFCPKCAWKRELAKAEYVAMIPRNRKGSGE